MNTILAGGMADLPLPMWVKIPLTCVIVIVILVGTFIACGIFDILTDGPARRQTRINYILNAAEARAKTGMKEKVTTNLHCQDCEQELTINEAVYPFARPFHDVALCPECTNRRWDRIPHGR